MSQPDLTAAQVKAVAWASRTLERTVAGAVLSVMGDRVNRQEARRRGARNEAFYHALQLDDMLQELRAVATDDADRDQTFDFGHLELADAWSELEGFMLTEGDRGKAEICQDRYRREYQLIAPNKRRFQDESRQQLRDELLERGIELAV